MNCAFIERLLAVAPWFQTAYAKHLEENGELLPHVFMGDVSREVIAACEQRSELLRLKALRTFLENELYLGNAEAKNLIRASFCENLIGEPHALAVLQPLMGPSLRQCMNGMKR